MLPTLSRISVSCGPVTRLRHRCSPRYLHISPLHREFQSPLPNSSQTVSSAASWLSHDISRQTYPTAYTPFTPSNSGQRSPPTYYRGCWHVVSRGLFMEYHQVPALFTQKPFSPTKEVYNPKAFIPHAASLRQACAHCGKFLTAASRRSLGRVSVPVWPFTLSGRLPVFALVGLYPTN